MDAFLTRRAFVAAGAALPFAWRGLCEPSSEARWVFLGTDTGAGIYRCTWDAATGKLGEPQLAVKADRPDFFALHPKLDRLYSVNSVGGVGAAVSCFELNRSAGVLRFVNKQSSRGDGPCFVSVDRTGRSAYVANYSSGSFAGFELTVDGSLLPATGTLQCKDSSACGHTGPVHDRQDSSHLHCATISPGNDFVLSCDLGNDAIEVIAIRPEADNPLGAAHRVAARPGSGPRHLAFHPNGRWVYVIHELDNTIERFDWTVSAGRASLLRKEGSAVTLVTGSAADGAVARPNSIVGSTACEIVIGASGLHVYSCTRGANILTVHRVEQDGALHLQQSLSCGGKTPRHFAFDPTGRFLLCANQAAPGNVTVFGHDAATGALSGPLQTVAAETPMFVQFA